jgi:F0F1-type ATP synthase gamma subunit
MLLFGKVFFEHAGTVSLTTAAPLAVAVSSDRGLCGGIHSSVSKATKRYLAKVETPQVVILGQKAKSQITREFLTALPRIIPFGWKQPKLPMRFSRPK